MRIAVITMVHNEHQVLPIWLRYYGGQVGEENLLVCDNDSNDGSTENLGKAGKIRLPRDSFDDTKRAAFLSQFMASLLTHYEVVIYTDCDEMLIPDPEKYPGGLQGFLQSNTQDYITPVGLNLVQLLNEEVALDYSKPILGQRRWVRFVSPMCKTVTIRKPVIYQSGFHSQNVRPSIDPNFYLFHLKRIDLRHSLARQAFTRSMTWADLRFGAHQRAPDSEVITTFERHALSPRISADRFDFSDAIREYESRIKFDSSHAVYSSHPLYMSNSINEVPERFFGVM
jgi:hypothetical protein